MILNKRRQGKASLFLLSHFTTKEKKQTNFKENKRMSNKRFKQG